MTQDDATTYLKEVKFADPPELKPRVDGRTLSRRTVGDDKLKSTSFTPADGSVTQAKMASSSIGQTQLKYADVSVSIANAATTGTAAVTTGDIVIGHYGNSVDQIVRSITISGTTCTVTLNAATALNPATVHVIVLHT